MSVLLYSAPNKTVGERLNTVIKTFVHKEEIEVLRTVEELFERLSQSKYDLDIAILVATNKEELRELVSISDLLGDIRIMLILPDKEEDTIAKGHALRPRFLSYVDSNFLDVAAVLIKMLAVGSSGYDFSEKDYEPDSSYLAEGEECKE